MTEIRYEGVVFSDGSVALRRLDPDPCDRLFRTFDSVRACNEELDRHEVIDWLADARPPVGRVTVREPNAQEVAYLLRHPDRPFPGPEELAAEGRYEPTEETDDP